MPATKKSKLERLLDKHEACSEGRAFALQHKTPQAAWDACTNPEWILWALDQLGVPQSALRKLACRFVRETPLKDGRKVWDLLTDERSRRAVEVAELHADGKASDEELYAAWDAARDAARDAAVAAAGYAAGYAARDAAGYAARDAAVAAAWAAAWDAAGAAAGDAARAAQCKIIREAFPQPPIKNSRADRRAA